MDTSRFGNQENRMSGQPPRLVQRDGNPNTATLYLSPLSNPDDVAKLIDGFTKPQEPPIDYQI